MQTLPQSPRKFRHWEWRTREVHPGYKQAYRYIVPPLNGNGSEVIVMKTDFGTIYTPKQWYAVLHRLMESARGDRRFRSTRDARKQLHTLEEALRHLSTFNFQITDKTTRIDIVINPQ